MGEYAEMMLDGTCCSCCGEFLEQNFDLDDLDDDGCVADTAPGFPMMCAACAAENEASGDGPFPNMTTAEIEAFIAEITAEMKGPLPNIERRLLHEERKELRAELKRRKEAEPSA